MLQPVRDIYAFFFVLIYKHSKLKISVGIIYFFIKTKKGTSKCWDANTGIIRFFSHLIPNKQLKGIFPHISGNYGYHTL